MFHRIFILAAAIKFSVKTIKLHLESYNKVFEAIVVTLAEGVSAGLFLAVIRVIGFSLLHISYNEQINADQAEHAQSHSVERFTILQANVRVL